MITSRDVRNVGKYFKTASGYVPNQFDVMIYKRGVSKDKDEHFAQSNWRNGKNNNPLYLINGEPWVVVDVTFPQIKFKQDNNIYVSTESLIKPDYILAVETSGNVEITVREKSDLAIYRSLLRCQTEIYTSKYEVSGTNLFGNNYCLKIVTKSQRFDSKNNNNDNSYVNIFGDNVIIFDRCLLIDISNPTFSYESKEFLTYKVTFEISSMAESYQNLVSGTHKDKFFMDNSTKFNNPESEVSSPTAKGMSTTPAGTKTIKTFNPTQANKSSSGKNPIEKYINGIVGEAMGNIGKGVVGAADGISINVDNNAVKKYSGDAIDPLTGYADTLVQSKINEALAEDRGTVTNTAMKIVGLKP